MSTEFAEKLVVALAGPMMTLLLAAIVGQRISAWWSERQKRRELELALANSFYSGYGEFCAIWKEWNWNFSEMRTRPDELTRSQAALHERACRAEGAIEAVLLKIAAERRLSLGEAAELGSLRQSFQVLRERIQANKPISYGSSDHPDYLEFKRLATLVGNLLAARSGRLPTATEAFDSFREITDNRHEARWVHVGQR
jgi:hypothetical protein